MACASQHPGVHDASALSGERLVGTASFALPPRYTSLRTSMTGLQVQLKDKWTFIRQQRLPRTLMSATLLRDAPTFERTSLQIKYPQPPQHFSPPEKIEVFNHLQDWAEANILPFLKPVEECWQPNDYLPDPTSQNFVDEVRELREECQDLPDDYLVCLVGDMITEEALPTYQTMLNTMDGIRDETGASLTSWARWNRAWTAEENRHGDLLNKYLYLSGRVDMRRVEQTIQYLIGSGMDPQTDNSAYLGIIYTSFQERATFVSHKNTARQALVYGDKKLAQICGTIAGDERRHERAYTKVVEKLFEVDPDYTMLCLEDMMRKKITMPAHLMFDGVDRNIYEKYALVAQRTGVYTATDYADILEHLLKRWSVQKLVGLSSRGQQAQDYVCSLPSRVRKLDERAQSRMKKGARMGTFSWIFDRKVAML